MRAIFLTVLLCSAGLAVACGSEAPFDETSPHVRMDFRSTATGFYAAPFPGAHRVNDQGIDLSGFPNPGDRAFVSSMITLLERDGRGAGVSSGIFFETTRAIDDASLPSVDDSIGAAGSQSVLVAPVLDDASGGVPVLGAPHPVHVLSTNSAEDFGRFAGTFGLSVVPYQGVPLLANTHYVAVVTDGVLAQDAEPWTQPPALRALLAGRAPEGLAAEVAESYLTAAEAVRAVDFGSQRIIGMTAFTTGDPTEGMREAHAFLRAAPAPTVSAFVAREVFDDFCVFEASIDMPVLQRGEPPFSTEGGEWARDSSGTLEVQRDETARLFVTVPRMTPPTDGFPAAIFVRTGGGGDRPLIDRGVRGVEGGPALTPGSGPAVQLSRAGMVGLSIDGPHGGPRNITNGDEQLLIFNFSNPVAMRDNIRQSALELTVLADLLGGLSIDASACPDVANAAVTLNEDRVALMGHSMGATIGPLAVAVEPRFRALALSGAGGSWIDNVLYKERPLPVLPLANIIVGYSLGSLSRADPALSLLLQWSGEPADPQVYARHIVDAPIDGSGPRHVLMMQGIVDTYIFPPIANGLSLPLGLDLGGPALEDTDPRSAVFESVTTAMARVGGQQLSYPVSGNHTSGVTAVVTQHPQDAVEDGHEAVFQTDGPKLQYQCFFTDFAAGRTPSVPAPDAVGCP